MLTRDILLQSCEIGRPAALGRLLILAKFEGMQFKTYDCDNCTSVSMANDIRTTKDVIGRLPKSPEAAMLEKARNQLERALENGRISIEERYTQDLVFATTMLTDWQMLSNLRIWAALLMR